MSLDIIVASIHELLNNTYTKFIISTTDNDLEDWFDIKSVLAEKIPNKHLIIEPFQEKQLFVRMLEQTVELNETNVNLLSQAFELCNGFPQQLKQLLVNLYANHGISIEENRVTFVAEAFQNLLNQECVDFDIEALCQKKTGMKTILQLISIWGAPIASNILYDFLDFFCDIDPISIFQNEIQEIVGILESLHILKRSYENRMMLFQFKHDSIKLSVTNYFRDDCALAFLHYSIYEYIMARADKDHNYYWNQYYYSLRAYHSFSAQTDDWIKYNYTYGNGFFEKNLFKEAEKIFSRLENVAPSLSGEQLLTIGITFFQCGKYYKADNLLSIIQNRNLAENFSLSQMVDLYTYQARTRSCTLDSAKALEAIYQAESLPIDEESLVLRVLGVKQSLLFVARGI